MYTHTVLTALFLYLFSSVAEGACPSGYTDTGGLCLVLSDLIDKWTDLSTYCQAYGGNLVTIDSASTQSTVRNFAAGLFRGNFWIGLNDHLIDREWYWYNRKVPFSYTNWNSGEPNGNLDEQCVGMVTDTGGWNDIDCINTSYRGVCETAQV